MQAAYQPASHVCLRILLPSRRTAIQLPGAHLPALGLRAAMLPPECIWTLASRQPRAHVPLGPLREPPCRRPRVHQLVQMRASLPRHQLRWHRTRRPCGGLCLRRRGQLQATSPAGPAGTRTTPHGPLRGYRGTVSGLQTTGAGITDCQWSRRRGPPKPSNRLAK